MNFARIEFCAVFTRKSGIEFFMASAVTISEGQASSLMVLIHEPNEDQISLGNIDDRYINSPCAINPVCICRWYAAIFLRTSFLY